MSGVLFGPGLRHPAAGALRRALVAAAPCTGPVSLYADTVLATYLGVTARDGARARWIGERTHTPVVLLDVHRAFLFFGADGPRAPRVGAVARWVVDGDMVSVSALAAHAAAHGPVFPHPPDALALLAGWWRHVQPGRVLAIDFATGEVRSSPLHAHPDESPPVVQRVPCALVVTEAGTSRSRDALEHAGTTVGPTLRAGGPQPALEVFVSRDVGPVRERAAAVADGTLPVVGARVTWSAGAHGTLCAGRAARPSDALFVATCEGLERFQVAYVTAGEPLTFAAYRALALPAVDPACLFYAIADGTPIGDVPIHWAWATRCVDCRATLVPARELWFGASELPGEPAIGDSSTSGCALGTSLEEAALFALFEAVERDAFLTTWYLRRRLRRIDLRTLRSERGQLMHRRWQHHFPDHEAQLFDMTSDVGLPSVLGLAVRRRGHGPRLFTAAATRVSGEAAVDAVLKDLCGFEPTLPDAARARFAQLARDPSAMRRPEDHFGLYAVDDSWKRLAFLGIDDAPSAAVADLTSRSPITPQPRYAVPDVLATCVDAVGGAGAEVYLKDITHGGVAAAGLRCARVVTPGLYPIWFGARPDRFAVTPRLRRLATRYGSGTFGGADDCNLDPHPFA